MKSIVSSLICSVALAGWSSVFAEQDVMTKSFDAQPGGKLEMKVDRGALHITSSESGKVEVKVVRELKGVSSSEAKELFEQHIIKMTQGDGVVRIETPERKHGWGFKNPLNKMRVDYTVSVPSHFNLDVNTAGGNVEVSDIEGNVMARTAGGDVKLGSIVGPVKAGTSGGNVILKGGKGDANLQTSGGDIRAGEITGDLVAQTSGGNIFVQKVKGKVNAHTSGGDVKVEEAYGTVTAGTSGGNVMAKLNEQPKGDSELRTSGGNVDLTVAENVALALNAKTSGGTIRSDFEGNLSKDRTRLTAQVNGGGPAVLLQTSGGNVSIRKQK